MCVSGPGEAAPGLGWYWTRARLETGIELDYNIVYPVIQWQIEVLEYEPYFILQITTINVTQHHEMSHLHKRPDTA
jgi:hypothetical protein